MLGIAGKNTSDADSLDACCFDLLSLGLGYLLVHVQDKLAGNRVLNPLKCESSFNSVCKRFLDLLSFLKGADVHTIDGSAVLFLYNYILCNIYKTSGKVTCVGCLEGCIGKTFSGSVTGDEELDD